MVWHSSSTLSCLTFRARPTTACDNLKRTIPDAWSMAMRLRQATNEYTPPPSRRGRVINVHTAKASNNSVRTRPHTPPDERPRRLPSNLSSSGPLCWLPLAFFFIRQDFRPIQRVLHISPHVYHKRTGRPPSLLAVSLVDSTPLPPTSSCPHFPLSLVRIPSGPIVPSRPPLHPPIPRLILTTLGARSGLLGL